MHNYGGNSRLTQLLLIRIKHSEYHIIQQKWWHRFLVSICRWIWNNESFGSLLKSKYERMKRKKPIEHHHRWYFIILVHLFREFSIKLTSFRSLIRNSLRPNKFKQRMTINGNNSHIIQKKKTKKRRKRTGIHHYWHSLETITKTAQRLKWHDGKKIISLLIYSELERKTDNKYVHLQY